MGKQAARAVAVPLACCSRVEAAAFCQALARHRTHSSAGGGGMGASASSASPSLACKAPVCGSVRHWQDAGSSRLKVGASWRRNVRLSQKGQGKQS